MTVYVSARAKYRTKDVEQIMAHLQKIGYEPACDWTNGYKIARPYRDPENRRKNLAAQAKMLETAASADVFILLDDEGLRGAYVELGAFLHDCIKNPADRTAYIVGPKSHEREFIFESPDYVKFADTIDEVYRELAHD